MKQNTLTEKIFNTSLTPSLYGQNVIVYSETNYVVIMIDYLMKRGRFTSLLDILSFLQIVSILVEPSMGMRRVKKKKIDPLRKALTVLGILLGSRTLNQLPRYGKWNLCTDLTSFTVQMVSHSYIHFNLKGTRIQLVLKNVRQIFFS